MRFFVIFCVLVFLVNHDGRTKVLPLCPDWVLCAHPAFLRCRSGLSGSLSRVDLQFSVTYPSATAGAIETDGSDTGRTGRHKRSAIYHGSSGTQPKVEGRSVCVWCVCVLRLWSLCCVWCWCWFVLWVWCVYVRMCARVRVGATHERSYSVRACVVLRVRPYRS